MRYYLAAFIICTALELLKNTCEVVCKHDGDEYGIIVNGNCVCGNGRDVSKYVFKFDSQKFKGKSVVTPTPPQSWPY